MADEDRELFNAAMSDAPAPEPTPEPAEAPQPEVAPEPKQDETGRLHGEKGRFVPKTPQEPVQPAQADAPKEPDHRVPLTELLNEREKRQQHERERDQYRQQAEAYQRQLAEFQQQQQQPPKTAPDIFEDPAGFVSAMREERRQELQHLQVNFSLQRAHDKYNQEFESAYNAALQARQSNDPAISAILASSDPGAALMRWYKSRTMLEKTGGDLDKFLKTHTDSLLDNEEFLAKAAEKIRARSSAQSNGQRPVVQLPPSLNRAPSAGPALDGDDDVSDAGLFRHALR